MSFSPNQTDKLPWYRQPLVWLVIFFPAATVVAGFITLGIAIKADDGVLIDDYYKKGKAINRNLARDKQATLLGLQGNSAYNPDNHQLMIQLVANQADNLPHTVHLQLTHNTRGGLDVMRDIMPVTPGHYLVSLNQPLAPGGWGLQISTPEWRVHGQLFVPDSYQTALAPIQTD